ncbi:MAG TPA: hypothetical protein VM029_09300 [Opitutaceae bacterium]|nr:hypothetical protein [Opitutaceae bacterium]
MAFVDAEIKVTVSRFNPMVPGRPPEFSVADFSLTSNNGGVTLANSIFSVDEKANLIFYFPDGKFAPQNLWFLQSVGSKIQSDPDGKLNLPNPETFEFGDDKIPAVQVKDNLKKGFKNAKWKVLIPVKRISDGAVGVIDPEVTNTNEER